MSTGTVFDIQRFSLHDGPGIRTTVFLKGCPLSCAWCQNPEGIDGTIRLWNFDNLCVGCGRCAELCRNGALSSTPGGRPRIDRGRCVRCGSCIEECLHNALALDGFVMDDRALAARLLDDRQFFSASGGGVTFSGGEPLVQAAFVRDIAKRLESDRITVAIETALHIPWENVATVLDAVDLFHVDLKIFDPDRHRRATGFGNRLIFENFRRLAEALADSERLRVRLPLIPGFTDDRDNISGIVDFIAGIDPGLKVELMNFNPLGEAKYRRMRLPYGVSADAKPYDDNAMRGFRNMALERLDTVL
ncbi:MAG: glycyl-radical enzyme activating protein [Planctomycetota bacterium]|jgi:pyruvate formate lyase activating enzyme|nr:glycyl-radical enzyme activating protein [Planctomycetota bacterium]